MNKKVIIAIVCVAIAVCVIAYEPKQKVNSDPVLPAGVYEFESFEYYIVELPTGTKVTDYFTLTGDEGVAVCDVTDVKSYHENLGIIYYRHVEAGGWVAYAKSQTGRFLYMPSDFPKEDVLLVSSRLALNIANNSSNYMTIEEAKQYISCLNN